MCSSVTMDILLILKFCTSLCQTFSRLMRIMIFKAPVCSFQTKNFYNSA